MVILLCASSIVPRHTLAAQLHAAGHEVVVAVDADEGTAFLQNRPVDLLLLDGPASPEDWGPWLRWAQTASGPCPPLLLRTADPAGTAVVWPGGAVRVVAPTAPLAELLGAASELVPARPPLTDDFWHIRGLFREIADRTEDIIYVKDRQGAYRFINQAWARFVGQPVEAVIGQTDGPILGAEAERWRRAQDERLMQFDLVEVIETTVVSPADGQKHQFLSSRGPVKDAAGAIVGVFGIAREITGLRQAELQMRQLQRAVEQSPVTIVITNRQGVIEYINPRFTELTGYTAAEAIGQTPRLLKSGRHPLAFYEQMWATITHGQQWRGTTSNRKKNGEIFQQRINISPVRDDSGQITHFVAIAEDITEFLRLEQQLLQAQKMEAIGLLAGGVAHDFNNLLTIIQLEVSTLLRANLPDPDWRDGAQQIAQATERATHLTRQLLTFSRRKEQEPRLLDLAELVENMAKLLRRMLGEDIELVRDFAPGLPAVYADPGMLEQVLLNLAVNSRDAMPQGGRLTLTLSVLEADAAYCERIPQARPGHFVRLEVRDSGQGIPPELLPRIFEPFFTTKAEGKGTGLGLATVYGIVRQHEGWVEVQSEVGVGTAFSMHLPAQRQTVAEAAGTDREKAMPRGAETVLLVEDDEAMRQVLRAILEHQGYRLLVAGTGADALQIARAHTGKIDLLLTDMVMPGGMNGRELHDRLGAERPGLKTLFISGYTRDNLLPLLGEELSRYLLKKPFSSEYIAGAVRQRLDAV